MAAPVRPEQSGQPGQQAGRVIPRAGSSSQQTQQTNQQQGQSTEGGQTTQPGASVASPAAPQEPSREQKLIAAQEALLREQQQQIARLTQSQREIGERMQHIENPPPSREDLNQQFWKDPVGVVGQLITSELKKTVEPINQYISGQRTETAYDRMKSKLKTEYGDIWPHIEGEVDRFVQAASQAGNEVNDQLLNVAALAATGAYHRGLLGPTSPSPDVTPPAPPANPPQPAGQRPDLSTPPHLRPSAPTTPGHERPQEKQFRELTENEKRLARERGMSPQQFLEWLDVPPDRVVHSQIGRQQA